MAHELPAFEAQHELVRQALQQLQLRKAGFYRHLNAVHLSELLQMGWRHALLCVLHVLRSDCRNLRAPAAYFTFCCKRIIAMPVDHDAAQQLWEQMACGDGAAGVPAFVQVWQPADVSHKVWLQVGGVGGGCSSVSTRISNQHQHAALCK